MHAITVEIAHGICCSLDGVGVVVMFVDGDGPVAHGALNGVGIVGYRDILMGDVTSVILVGWGKAWDGRIVFEE